MSRSETIQTIFSLMGQMKRTMRQQFHSAYQQLSLSPAQFDLLISLHEHQPLSHKALANQVHLTPGAVSQLLDGLDNAGYILRTNSDSDRRVSYLSISREGKRKIDEFRKLREQLFTGAFSVLSDEELAAFANVQTKMITWFEANQQVTTKQ